MILIATYDQPESEGCFSGTVISVLPESAYPVGIHRKDWIVGQFEWVHPRTVLELHNN